MYIFFIIFLTFFSMFIVFLRNANTERCNSHLNDTLTEQRYLNLIYFFMDAFIYFSPDRKNLYLWKIAMHSLLLLGEFLISNIA